MCGVLAATFPSKTARLMSEEALRKKAPSGEKLTYVSKYYLVSK